MNNARVLLCASAANPLKHARYLATTAAAIALAITAAGAPAQPPPSSLRSVDLYRTTQLESEAVEERYEPAIREFVAAMAATEFDSAGSIYREIIDSIQASGDFAHVDLGVTTSFEAGENVVYATIEVVDHSDAAARLSFGPEPTESVDDPAGVLEAWGEYQRIGFELLNAREIEGTDDCPAHHCFVGFEHEALAPFLQQFDRAAREHRSELVRVLREDADAQKRANAAFVLAHSEDANALIRDLIPLLADPASGVRNNVMRVMLVMAQRDDTLDIPFEPVARRLDDPDSGCRNKAAYLIAALAHRPEYRDDIVSEGPAVLRLLRLKKPNNHEPAYQILTTISGEDFGARDYERWEQWLEQARLEAQRGSASTIDD